jgi:hypothetical protein
MDASNDRSLNQQNVAVTHAQPPSRRSPPAIMSQEPVAQDGARLLVRSGSVAVCLVVPTTCMTVAQADLQRYRDLPDSTEHSFVDVFDRR